MSLMSIYSIIPSFYIVINIFLVSLLFILFHVIIYCLLVMYIEIIECILYYSYYEKTNILSYCGYQKPHPHIDMCKLRIGFKEAILDKNVVVSYLMNASDAAIKIYERIALSFKD